jgi:16S rRNA (cytidine1402-2'-O)-methyltransferase
MSSRRIDNRTRPRDSETPRIATFTAFGLQAEAQPLAPGLHVVATPIGNLKDITLRALGALAGADVVLAEDTRVTRHLLAHYGITTPLVTYNEHSAAVMRPRIIARLEQGQALALVSDAGTPLVSDPGYKLVEAAIEAGIPVTTIPGPSAVTSALVVSGLPSDRFFFEGFLPPREAARRARLAELAPIPGTLIFFEAPHRLPAMLADAAAVLGARDAAVARELTKLYETVLRAQLPELAARFEADGPPKGEIVVLIGPPSVESQRAESLLDLDGLLERALADHSVRDAAAMVAQELGLPRKDVYARALALAAEREATDTPE